MPSRALYLHDTQFISAAGGRRLNFIQAKKEEDSDALLRRCLFIYEHQEPWLKAMCPAEYSYCHLRFYRPKDTERKLAIGELWGIPQGADVLRQHTASGLFCDEGAFQPDLEATVRAAMPMLFDNDRWGYEDPRSRRGPVSRSLCPPGWLWSATGRGSPRARGCQAYQPRLPHAVHPAEGKARCGSALPEDAERRKGRGPLHVSHVHA